MTAVKSYLDERLKVWRGDSLAALKTMPSNSVDCCVSSPPYWGLRDYGVDGQIGLEHSLAEHIEILVAIFEEVRRILKPDGTLWLNYGDCYASTPNGRSAADTKSAGNDDRTFRDKPFSTVGPVCVGENPKGRTKVNRGKHGSRPDSNTAVVAGGYLKPKDLCMLPNRIAIALQDAGWWVRSEIIWAKPNPMPESVRDRPATAHEKIWLLTKSERYFYNHGAARQGRSQDEDANGFRGLSYVNGEPSGRKIVGNNRLPHGWASSEKYKGQDPKFPKRDKQRGHSRRHAGFNDRWDHMSKEEQPVHGRNLRNWEPAPLGVWEIATRAFSEAHFATFPPDLVHRCLLAGCPRGGVVLDPFGGAGTTGLVALRMGMKAHLIELNPEYIEIAVNRIEGEWGGDINRAIDIDRAEAPGPLFEGV